MPRGRPKTLPPCKFVGVLIPLAFLDKVEDVRRAGQKGCSSYSFSEAIRDVLAKGLDVTWKPVDHGKAQPKVEPASSVEQKKPTYEEAYTAFQKEVREYVRNRPKGQHWATALKECLKEYWGDDDYTLKLYSEILTVYRGSERDDIHEEWMKCVLDYA
jgi:hypothetical protein